MVLIMDARLFIVVVVVVLFCYLLDIIESKRVQ